MFKQIKESGGLWFILRLDRAFAAKLLHDCRKTGS